VTDPNEAAAYLRHAEVALDDGASSSPAPAIRAALHIGVAIAISLQEAVDSMRSIEDTLQEAVAQLGEINDGLTQ
jgi:hypothetical protein